MSIVPTSGDSVDVSVFASVVLMLTSVCSVVVGNIFSLRLIRSRQGKSLSQPGSYAQYRALQLERLTY
jgi:hypothetical protein